MADTIDVTQPCLGEQELDAVREVFDSNRIARGAKADEFESAFADHVGVHRDHVTSVNSGTEAVSIALELLGVGPGDDVVLPTVGPTGTPNAIAARGARPVFCDVDPATLNADLADVEAALTTRTKAVVPLHYGGHPGAVVRIADLCRQRGIHLVEDAALAVDSRVDGQACGTLGDIDVWAYGSEAVLPKADRAAGKTLLLPMHQGLTDADADRVVSAVRERVLARTEARVAVSW